MPSNKNIMESNNNVPNIIVFTRLWLVLNAK